VKELPQPQPTGSWVQTERKTHEAWIALMRKSPVAAEILHLLVSRIGDRNAVVMAQSTMAKLLNRHRTTINRGLQLLAADRWIEIRQIGETKSVNAYIVNSRVAWQGSREGLRYALFSAVVVVSEEDQPDKDQLGQQEQLRPLPRLLPGEEQMPAGPGLPPPTEPPLIDVDLPVAGDEDPKTGIRRLVGEKSWRQWFQGADIELTEQGLGIAAGSRIQRDRIEAEFVGPIERAFGMPVTVGVQGVKPGGSKSGSDE
jgi:hypothetical protein